MSALHENGELNRKEALSRLDSWVKQLSAATTIREVSPCVCPIEILVKLLIRNEEKS